MCPYDMGEWGGGQSQARDLVERVRAVGDDAYLVGPGVPAGLGLDVGSTIQVPGNESRSPISLSPITAARTVRALVGADVVHVHEPLMPVIGPAALRAGRPTVATFHAAVAPWTEKLYGALAPLGRGLLGSARLTAVSEMAVAGLPPSWAPVTIIPNGVDVASFAVDVDRDRSRVAFLGRDDPRKGLDVILAAWGRVRSTRPGAKLSVMGADRGTAIEGVVWHGRVPDEAKRSLLASSAVFVAPNTGGESFGIVLVEAMAAGCAIVASDLPAFRSVVGEAGILVPSGDSAALA